MLDGRAIQALVHNSLQSEGKWKVTTCVMISTVVTGNGHSKQGRQSSHADRVQLTVKLRLSLACSRQQEELILVRRSGGNLPQSVSR